MLQGSCIARLYLEIGAPDRISEPLRGFACRRYAPRCERSPSGCKARTFGALQKESPSFRGILFVNRAPDRIRTCDPCLRRAVLYPAELRAHCEVG